MTAKSSFTDFVFKFNRIALPLFAVFSLTAMAPMNIAFGLVCLSWLLGLTLFCDNFFSDEVVLVRKKYLYFSILFTLTCLISVVASIYWPYSYADHAPSHDTHTLVKLLHFVFPLIYLSVFALRPSNDQSYDTKLKVILKAWWIAVLVLGVVGIIQFFTGIIHKQVIPTSPSFYHVTLFFGHHLSTASIMLFPTFAALATAMGIYRREHKIAKLEWSAGLTGLLILFLSFARAAWLALPIGIALLLLLLGRKKLIRLRSMVFGFAVSLLLLIGLFQTPLVQDRIQNQMGINDRLELWKANLDFFEHRPLTGIGFLKTQEMSEFYFKTIDPDHYKERFWGHAHSNYFEMLGGAGLLGLLGLLAWIGYSIHFAFKTSVQARNQGDPYLGDLAVGLGIALILMHINGLTQVNFWEGKVFHQQMWAMGILLMIHVKLFKKDGMS